jgi:tetratricopeptide (TPR) repeat protein
MTRVFVCVFLFLSTSVLYSQKVRELKGTLEILDEKGIVEDIGANIEIVIKEIQSSDITNSNGFFRIPINELSAGAKISFIVKKSGYVIYRPHNGLERIPKDLDSEQITIKLIKRGSRLLMSYAEIELLIQSGINSEKKQNKEVSPNLSFYIKNWASTYGFSLEEVQKQIDLWAEEVQQKSDDLYKLGLAAYAKRQFESASKHFENSKNQNVISYEELSKQEKSLEKRKDSLRKKIVRDYKLKGQSLLQINQPQQALTAYQEALKYIKIESDSIELAELKSSEATAHRVNSYRVKDQKIQKESLLASFEAYSIALKIYQKLNLAIEWAWTKIQMGTTLSSLANLVDGAKAEELVNLSLESKFEAYGVSKQVPKSYLWAYNMSVIADSFEELSEFEERVQADSLNIRAYAVHKMSLDVFTKEDYPQEWAKAQFDIGRSLISVYSRRAAQREKEIVQEIMSSLRSAMEVYDAKKDPDEWVYLQSSMASFLKMYASRSDKASAASLLQEALEIYQSTDSIISKNKMPFIWASRQAGYGSLYLELGRNVNDKELSQLYWKKSFQYYDDAESTMTYEARPQMWRHIQTNKGACLLRLARVQNKKEAFPTLDRGIKVVEKVLAKYTNTQQWSLNQANLGIMNTMKGEYDAAYNFFKNAASKDIPSRYRDETFIAVQALEIVLHLKNNQTSFIETKVNKVIETIEKLPSDFYISQSVRGGDLFVEENPEILKNRDWIEQFFRALQPKNKKQIIEQLQAFASNFN